MEERKMKFGFNHFNFNVIDLDKSIEFYDEALGLKESHRLHSDDGSYEIVYLKDEQSSFLLELTWLRDHPQKYDLGELEFHLALKTDDYEAALKKHQEMGIVVFVNEKMGIYFIQDLDGYWIEIIP